MNFDLIRQHAVAVKDVVDIQADENQQIIRFGRVGSVKFKKAAPAFFIMAVAIASGCLHLSVGKIIVALVIVALVCWSLVDVFSVVAVDINRKKLSVDLFNITLNEFISNGVRKKFAGIATKCAKFTSLAINVPTVCCQ